VAGLAAAVPGAASAAPKLGCPAAASGWYGGSIGGIASTVWQGLLDQSPWTGFGDFEAEIAALDSNGDGDLCVVARWGDHLNPKSHWYQVGMDAIGEPASYFLVTDNRANGSNG
jgi:hypothetical protein